jgi:hypothetical protein
VSAPAPALAPRRRVLTVRLADAAEAVAGVSLVFGLLLMIFPLSFPRLIITAWQHGQLMPAVMVFTLLLDTVLYLRVASILSAKPGMGAAAGLGSLPLLVVGGLNLLLTQTVAHAVSGELPNLQARVGEEILAHTYLSLVGGIFLPFMVIRLLQQLRAKEPSTR